MVWGDVAGAVFGGVDLPDLFDPQAVGLWLGLPAQVELRADFFRERAVAAFGEQGYTGVEFHAAFKGCFGLAGARETEVVGRDAGDTAVGGEGQFGAREARIQLDTEGFGDVAEILGKLGERDDVVAGVVHLRRGGDGDGAGGCEKAQAVFCRGGGVREVVVGRRIEPVWEELVEGARFQHVAAEDVPADLRGFFEHHHAEVLVAGGVGELFEADGGGEAGGAGADDQDIDRVRFAVDSGGVEGGVVFDGSIAGGGCGCEGSCRGGEYSRGSQTVRWSW